jgi:hypothetical protein
VQPHDLSHLGTLDAVEVFERGEVCELDITLAADEEKGQKRVALDRV